MGGLGFNALSIALFLYTSFTIKISDYGQYFCFYHKICTCTIKFHDTYMSVTHRVSLETFVRKVTHKDITI